MAHLSKPTDSGYIEDSSDRWNSSDGAKPGLAGRKKNEVTFVDNVDKWKCPLCTQILINPVQTLCGHRFCDACITEHIDQNGDPCKCPVDESDCEMVSVKEKSLFKDASARREILNLLVRCIYYCFGCKENIEWRNYEKHIRNCDFKRWPCLYQDKGCPEMLKEKYVQAHVKMCKFQPKPCSICKQTEGHDSGCENRSFSCTYQSVGCNFTGVMSKLEDHSKVFMPQHLELTFMSLEKMTNENSHLKSQMKEAENQLGIAKKKIEQLEKENRKVVERLKKVEKTMLEQNKCIKEMETRVSGLSEDVNTQQIELNSLQNSGLVQRGSQGGTSTAGKNPFPACTQIHCIPIVIMVSLRPNSG